MGGGGEEFEDGIHQEIGHVQVDFGLDSLFVQESVELTDETQAKIRDNVAKLVEFTKKAENMLTGGKRGSGVKGP